MVVFLQAEPQKHSSLKRLFVYLLGITLMFVSLGLAGCGHTTSKSSPTAAKSAASQASPTAKKTYEDIPTLYPNLYKYSSAGPWKNTYDESKVIDWSEAENYVGQTVTVEGYAESVIHAASSNGSPYYFNIGAGAYEGFAIVIWSEDLSNFEEFTLNNYVDWSISGQPLTFPIRASGKVELYNGRPQIVARDGSQIAEYVNDSWSNMLSQDIIENMIRTKSRSTQ